MKTLEELREDADAAYDRYVMLRDAVPIAYQAARAADKALADALKQTNSLDVNT